MRRLLATLLPLFLWIPIVLASNDSHEMAAIRFVQNKGQWESKVLYAADIPMGRVFLERDRLTYVFCDVSELHERYFHHLPGAPADSMLDCHSFQVLFAGANQPNLVGEGKAEGYNNYFIGADPSKWASEVPLFDKVRYQGVYPGIDFLIYAHGNTLKYDFVAAPGANVGQIRLDYKGLDALTVAEGRLQMVTSVTTIQEDRPVAFQSGEIVPCSFSLNGNSLGFIFPEGYDGKQELIIDPTLIFSTFTGSFSNNFGFTATYDDNGNLYAGGICFGPNYPVTQGTFQTSFGGGFDVSISKFGPFGVHHYSTFIGGGNSDQPHSMVCDAQGNLYIYGMTKSGNFPTRTFAYDQTLSGGSDIFISKLNPTGTTLLAGTLVGGDASDAMNMDANYSPNSIKYNYGDDARGEIVVDELGDVYVASCTRSSNFPTTAGCYKPQISSSQDGVVFKMNTNLSQLVWSTHLGGNGDDAAYSLKLDDSKNVYVVGGTTSGNFPTTSGVISATRPGGIDGFVTHLNSTGSGLIASTYIGTTSYDQCYFVEIDGDGDVYIMGQTNGAFPVTPGAWSFGTTGQFIQKLEPSLTNIIYSTHFGSGSNINIAPTAFLVDVCEFVYVSGWGGATNFQGSTSGLPVSSNAMQSNTDGSDLYLIVLRKDAASLNYATFIGGGVSHEHVDGGTSRFSKNAEVYQAVCAGCWNNSDFPTTPGAFSATNNGGIGSCNLACFKMDLEIEGILADFDPVPATGGCAPHTVQFQNQSIGANSYFWNFGDPTSGGSNTSTFYNTSHTFQNPGTYNVMLVVANPASCNGFDTTYRIITVYPDPNVQLPPDTTYCEGNGINLTATGAQNYQWSPSTGLNTTTGSSVFANPTGTVTYTVIGTNTGGCADTAQVTISMLPSPTANAGTGGFICPGDSLQLSGTGGGFYAWSSPGTLSNPAAPNPIAFPTQTTTYTLTVTALNGCTDFDTVTVQVSTVRAQPGPDIDLCIGESATINASGGGTYLWQPPLGLSSTTIANPVANPSNTITYGLTVTDAFGCTSTDSITVFVHPLPIIDIGPDLLMCENDTVQLQAIGASTYTWSPGTSLSNPNSASPLAYPTSDITYIVTGADQYGCEDQDTLFIEVMPAPTAQAWGGAVICQDSSIQVFASGGNTYQWAPAAVFNNPAIQNPIATLTQTTDLIVTVYATNGCRDWDTVHVPVTPTPVARIVGPPLLCLGQWTSLLGSGGEDYLWNTGETTIRINVDPDTTTVYTLTTWVDGCPSEPDSLTMTVDTMVPAAFFVASPDSGILPFTTTLNNLSTNSSSWIWTFGDGASSNEFSPMHEYQDTGRFDVQLISISPSGCRDTISQKVIVGADFTIYVPTAFTPNGDGLNDGWGVKWIGVKWFHVMLFDRWGMMIYESYDPDFSWDGSLHTNEVQEGVYTFVIEARGYLSEKVKRAGTVTLLR
ncbi:MAG: PKD domain-containing protein [Bacteroidia bacterium]